MTNRIPESTYRIQFNPAFGFKEALAIVEYLSVLGISDLYASPIFKARKGSSHGYDIVDPNELNPDLGSVRALKARKERAGLFERGAYFPMEVKGKFEEHLVAFSRRDGDH